MHDLNTSIHCDCDLCSASNDRRAAGRYTSDDGDDSMPDDDDYLAMTPLEREMDDRRRKEMEGDSPMVGKRPLMDIVDDRAHSAMIPAQGQSIIHCPGNIDSSTQRGKALLLKAGGPGEYMITDTGVLRMCATHWLIIPDSQCDEKTGEVREFTRTVLFDAAGKHFRTTASHAPFRLRAMLDLYSPAEWAAGIPIVVSVRKSKRGTTYHDIQIDLDALA